MSPEWNATLGARWRKERHAPTRLEGSQLEGEVSMQGDIEVGPSGVVRAHVAAGRVDVRGQLVGDVQAGDACLVRRGGSIEGDVRAARVSLEDGGRLVGAVDMDFELPRDWTEP